MRDAIDMAREAGFEIDCTSLEWHKRIKAFAELVRADEREACAKEADHWQGITDRAGRINKDGEYIAAAIRARGNT
jgi:hypothetical protein